METIKPISKELLELELNDNTFIRDTRKGGNK